MASTRSESGSPGPAGDPEVDPLHGDRPALVPTAVSAPDDATFAQLAWTLIERRWTAIGVAAAVVAAAAVYALAATPVYESSFSIQLDGRGVSTGFADVARLFERETATEGQIRIIKSRALLEHVVDHLRLDVEARPRTVPLIGNALARLHRGSLPASAPLGLRRFAWGGERIAVERLEVTEGLVEEPLVVTALDDGLFTLSLERGAVLVEGAVGQPVIATNGERRIELLVSQLAARPGTEFILRKLRRVEAVDRLQNQLKVEEAAKDTGLIVVTLSGTDPQRIATILDAISTTFVRQNLERTSAAAVKALGAFRAQLPVLKSDVEKVEVALNRFHQKNGTVSLSSEAAAMLGRTLEIDRAIAESELRAAELAKHYTDRHPDVPAFERRAEQLRIQRATMEARLRALPALELESVRLSREITLATEAYLVVLHRAQELEMMMSTWIGTARAIDQPVAPLRPVRPQRAVVFLIATVLGIIGGVAAAFARKEFDRSVRDPEDIEAATRIPVFATIARSTAQRKLARRSGRGLLPALAAVEPSDPAVEDLRALRTSVQFALLRAGSNVVAIGGLGPNDGKSFVSVNLAHLLAAAGGRVVLVDGDLRRGALHRYFGAGAQPGLADVLGRTAELDSALRRTENANLDVLPAGAPPNNPAELLASPALEQLIGELAKRYKVVIIDTPPILAVNDGALVGRHAGVNLLVLRSGEHPIGDLEYAVSQLVRSGVSVRGAILNDMRSSLGRYGRLRRYRRIAGTAS